MGDLVLGQGRLRAVPRGVWCDLMGGADAGVFSSVAVRSVLELLDELVGVDLNVCKRGEMVQWWQMQLTWRARDMVKYR